MEEKERYELFGEFGIIHDTSPNAECMLLNKFQTCEILNKQDKENQQLKQQLAEKDKVVENLQEINQSLGQTCNNDAKEIERLRELISKKEKENDKLISKLEQANEIINNPDTLIFQQQQLIDNLQSQLAEKEKELKKIKNLRATPKQLQRAYQERYKYKERCNELKNQHLKDKISFAVEQLEKVKDYFIEGYAVCKNFSDFYWNFTEQIDNQIEELKKEIK